MNMKTEITFIEMECRSLRKKGLVANRLALSSGQTFHHGIPHTTKHITFQIYNRQKPEMFNRGREKPITGLVHPLRTSQGRRKQRVEC